MARWLQRRPEVLLLDEPTQGVDIGARNEIHALIREAAAAGTAVLVVSSDFAELAALAHRALVVSAGHVVDSVSGPLTEDTLNDVVYAQENAHEQRNQTELPDPHQQRDPRASES